MKTSNLLFQILKTKFRFKKIRVNSSAVVFVGVASLAFALGILFPIISLLKARSMIFFGTVGVLIGIALVMYILRWLFSVIFEVD